jgi:hypothetical protein
VNIILSLVPWPSFVPHSINNRLTKEEEEEEEEEEDEIYWTDHILTTIERRRLKVVEREFSCGLLSPSGKMRENEIKGNKTAQKTTTFVLKVGGAVSGWDESDEILIFE